MKSDPTRAVNRRSGNFELYSWFFMRVTGVALLFLAVFHLMLMHFYYGVDNIKYDLVADRWDGPFWRVYDLLLLIFAMSHGTNGMRWVLDDYVRTPGWNVFSKTLLYLISGVIVIMGAYVLFTFQR